MTNAIHVGYVALICSLLIAGCEQKDMMPQGELAATVNSSGISFDQVNYELFLAKRQNPNLNAVSATSSAVEQ